MADAASNVFSFPPDNVDTLSAKEYEKAVVDYLKVLDKTPRSFWLSSDEKQSIFNVLNPASQSIPYTYALRHNIKAAEGDNARLERLLDVASIYFTCFDVRQVRYVTNDFSLLLSWYFEGFRRSTKLQPLAAALLRLDPTAGTFTSFHLRFVQLCLENDVPSQALPIIDLNISAFPQQPLRNSSEAAGSEEYALSNTFIHSKSGLTEAVRVQHILEYYLLGSYVYIGSQIYDRARLFLEIVLLSPTHNHVVSSLQIEAYKKWVLVGLLVQGKPFPPPRTFDQSVLKTIKSIAKPYDGLAEVVRGRKWRRYQAEMAAGAQIWMEDGNHEMVRQVGIALHRYIILDLQKTYAVLPVSRVAGHTESSIDDTLRLLTDMIRNGHLSASVTASSTDSPGDAVLQFHGATASPASVSAVRHDFQAQTQRVEELVHFIQDADRRLQISREYVEHVRRQKRAALAQEPEGDLAEQMDLTWDAPPGPAGADDVDEDIMAA